VASTTGSPWLKIEHTHQGYEVRWRVERRSGQNIVLDLGCSQCFATKSEAQRWSATLASAFSDEEPLPPS
jgi:hypothetical protein